MELLFWFVAGVGSIRKIENQIVAWFKHYLLMAVGINKHTVQHNAQASYQTTRPGVKVKKKKKLQFPRMSVQLQRKVGKWKKKKKTHWSVHSE